MNRMLELGDVATVFAPKHVVGLEETDADEFLHQSIPLALVTGFISVREGFLEHRERPSLGEREGRVAFFQIPCHLRAQRVELVFGARFARGG